ncbi:hypothetical protein ACFPM7_21090 [Actinokineospora guangxiensis]|uniref:Uncharacterized protein n=1 Tax=Actinokineospora guangxiensis TaxID=1490288 RepID=A0ABW0EQG8_9PSEU
MVGSVAAYHAAITEAMRGVREGAVHGWPRATRFRWSSRPTPGRLPRPQLGPAQHGETASNLEKAKALAVLIELAGSVSEEDRLPECGAHLAFLPLTDDERGEVTSSVADPAVLAKWMA